VRWPTIEITLVQQRIKESSGQISHSSLQLRTTDEKGNFLCPDSSQTTRLFVCSHGQRQERPAIDFTYRLSLLLLNGQGTIDDRVRSLFGFSVRKPPSRVVLGKWKDCQPTKVWPAIAAQKECCMLTFGQYRYNATSLPWLLTHADQQMLRTRERSWEGELHDDLHLEPYLPIRDFRMLQ